MTRNLGAIGVLASAVALGACSGPAQEAGKTSQSLEVYNWWTNPGETDALAALLSMYEEQYPDTVVINAAVDTLPKAQEELQSRMTSGAPPDTFQVIGGWNLLRWVVFNGQDASDSKLEPVDSIVNQSGMRDVIPQVLVDTVSYDGQMYSVPLATHRFNTLFFNKQMFEDLALTPPSTLEDFYLVAPLLQARGIDPLALGAKDGFFVSILTWDGVLIAKAGPEFRESYFSGQEQADDPRIVETLEEVARMLDYTNVDRSETTWNGAAQMVIDGEAAMTVMGDWAKGYFLSQGWSPESDLGQAPTPGTRGVFVYIVNSFTLPYGVAGRDAAVDFLNLVASREAHDVFNPIKGSISPRTDTNLGVYDQLARDAMDEFQTSTLTRARPVIVKNPAFLGALDEAMKQFAIDRDVDTVVNVLKNRYDQLQ